jgi:hypothetical protein
VVRRSAALSARRNDLGDEREVGRERLALGMSRVVVAGTQDR